MISLPSQTSVTAVEMQKRKIIDIGSSSGGLAGFNEGVGILDLDTSKAAQRGGLVGDWQGRIFGMHDKPRISRGLPRRSRPALGHP